LGVREHPQQIVQDEDQAGSEQRTVGEPFPDRDAAPGMIGQQSQWCQRLVLRGTRLDAHRLPGELLKDQYDALLGVLEPRQPKIGISPLGSLGFHTDARHLNGGGEGGAHEVHVHRVDHYGDAIDYFVDEAVFTLWHLRQSCGSSGGRACSRSSACISSRWVTGLYGDAHFIQGL